MTANDMMTPRALLEKSSDADLLREMIGFAAARLMALEVEELTGVPRPPGAAACGVGMNSAADGIFLFRPGPPGWEGPAWRTGRRRPRSGGNAGCAEAGTGRGGAVRRSGGRAEWIGGNAAAAPSGGTAGRRGCGPVGGFRAGERACARDRGSSVARPAETRRRPGIMTLNQSVAPELRPRRPAPRGSGLLPITVVIGSNIVNPDSSGRSCPPPSGQGAAPSAADNPLKACGFGSSCSAGRNSPARGPASRARRRWLAITVLRIRSPAACGPIPAVPMPSRPAALPLTPARIIRAAAGGRAGRRRRGRRAAARRSG